ncbi:unnamed protein product [Moneuplotes crassus]|uniref:Tubulin-specific chaperone D n=1 Tax=Euplotes crassus TaxID=5936 RepID=A0AAD1XEK4_EUPCR|nr:unnamed protein product [Moneuplotes crassus]
MDAHLENKFLGNEKAFVDAYNEQVNQPLAFTKSKDDFNTKVYDSFVIEKDLLLGYLQDLLHWIKNGNDTTNEAKIVTLNTEQDCENVSARVIWILSKYQEQPELLDSMLSQFISPIINYMVSFLREDFGALEKPYNISQTFKMLLNILYKTCEVRGTKTVLKYFPHSVEDLENLVEFIANINLQNWEWYVHYILFMWLSMVVIVPFDLETIDSKKEGDETLLDKIINFSEGFLNQAGKNKEISSQVVAKLLTRPDVIKLGYLDSFIEKMKTQYIENINNPTKIMQLVGCLQVLCDIFKTGQRSDLFSRVETVFDTFIKTESEQNFIQSSSMLKKQRVKFAHKLGLIFLKPRVASWRYQMDSKSLLKNLDSESKNEEAPDTGFNYEENEDDDMDSDCDFECLETIISILLSHLKDKDTSIRWSAAKGLGKITSRLTLELADQIVEDILKCFDDSDTDSSWQGGCLALAELCREGLLLPERLDQVMPKLKEALLFDINKGDHSVGAHVRDAACYVVWSFARSFKKEIMKPHVESLSTHLCILFLFDREVNCRRAGSAAFQESVGRQRIFPHGIEILAEADYFTLANKANSFLNVSTYIAQFEEYYDPLINNLVNEKLKHWETEMRQLAAKSLSVLSIFNPQHVIDNYLPTILKNCFSKVLHIRHGALWALSELMLGLSGLSHISRNEKLEEAMQQIHQKEIELIKQGDNKEKFNEKFEELQKKNNAELIPKDLMDEIKQVIFQMDEQKLFKGKGGEIMRLSVNHYLQCCSFARIQFSNADLQKFQKMIDENSRHSNVEVQKSTCAAYKQLSNTYFNNDAELEEEKKFVINSISEIVKRSVVDPVVDSTRGYNMILGSLSKSIISKMQQKLLKTLIGNMVPKGKSNDDPESRQFAVRSTIDVLKTVGLNNVDPTLVKSALDQILKAVQDYAIDKRGDVGSWVREEAMRSLNILIYELFYNCEKEVLEQIIPSDAHQDFFIHYIGTILQQLMEKIDKVRQVAGQVLQSFLVTFKNDLPNFDEKDTLLALFIFSEEGNEENTLDSTFLDQRGYLNAKFTYKPWRNPSFVFQQVISLFDSPSFAKYLCTGIVSSSGGLTESTVKNSLEVLIKFISEMKGTDTEVEKKNRFLNYFNDIFEENLKEERITVPLMKTLESLIRTTYFEGHEYSEQFARMHSLIQKENFKSKNIPKLITCAGILGELVQFDEIKEKSLRSLLLMLFNPFPKVRKLVAENLYNYLLTFEEPTELFPDEDTYDEAIILLSETEWGDKLKQLNAEVKPAIFKTFGQEPPKKKAPAQTEQN